MHNMHGMICDDDSMHVCIKVLHISYCQVARYTPVLSDNNRSLSCTVRQRIYAADSCEEHHDGPINDDPLNIILINIVR